VLSVSTDITERKRVEEDRERLEVELRQAQKMDSVGCSRAASRTTSTTC